MNIIKIAVGAAFSSTIHQEAIGATGPCKLHVHALHVTATRVQGTTGIAMSTWQTYYNSINDRILCCCWSGFKTERKL